MGNNDLTKLTRWIVPGWLAIISFYGFVIVDIVFHVEGKPAIYPSAKEFLDSMLPFNGVLEVFFLAAAGVPLGFSIYQVYFFLRWNSLVSRDGLLPPFLPGRMDELDQSQGDIQDIEFSLGVDWREKLVTNPFYRRDHGVRSRYQELFFLEAVQKIDADHNDLGFLARHLYLHEIAHTLGASAVAIYVGFFSYAFLKMDRGKLPLTDYLFVTAVVVGIFLFLVNYEYKKNVAARKGQPTESLDERGLIPTFVITPPFDLPIIRRKEAIYFVSPAAQFVFGLLLIHMWANPNLIEDGDISEVTTLLRGLLSIFAILTWLRSKKDHSLSSKIGDWLTLGTSLIFAFLIPNIPHLVDWIDWSYFTALILFLLANMVLFFNRQNTKEQTFALQYYVLKKYLIERRRT